MKPTEETLMFENSVLCAYSYAQYEYDFELSSYGYI